jgi:hypothetical protein
MLTQSKESRLLQYTTCIRRFSIYFYEIFYQLSKEYFKVPMGILLYAVATNKSSQIYEDYE